MTCAMGVRGEGAGNGDDEAAGAARVVRFSALPVEAIMLENDFGRTVNAQQMRVAGGLLDTATS